MRIAKKILNGFMDFLEIHLTVLIFLTMFVSFLTGVFFRYILRNPQSWTFELSQICILMLAMLASSTTQREEGHVVFDMIYIRSSPRVQTIMRIIAGIIIVGFFGIVIPHSIIYLWDMRGLYMQVIKIPRFLVFMPLSILLITMFTRYAYRLFLDVKAFANKTYGVVQNTETGGVG